MSRIYVCPLSKVEETVRACGAGALVTLIEEPLAPPRPAGIAAARHLIVPIADVVDECAGGGLAQDADVARLIDFVAAWDRRAPMAIHCFAGVSRSTAAAFIAACALEPAVDERFFARSIRLNSPTASPNPHLVRLADARLGRNGRMISALAAIGRAIPCSEARPFSFGLAPPSRDGRPL